MKEKKDSACVNSCFCPMDIELLPDERVDDLQLHGLRIIQSLSSFRFGMDAVLLSDFAAPRVGDKVVDLGCHDGILPLLLYGRRDTADYTGIDIDESSLERGQRSLLLNQISSDKITLKYGDIRKIKDFLPVNSASLVVCNPPYHAFQGGDTRHAQARAEESCSLPDVVRAARFLLKNKGRFCMIFPASRLQEACVTLYQHGFSLKRLRLIQYSLQKSPKLMLLESMIGAKPGEVQVLPTLMLRENGQDNEEIRQIYHQSPADPDSSQSKCPL